MTVEEKDNPGIYYVIYPKDKFFIRVKKLFFKLIKRPIKEENKEPYYAWFTIDGEDKPHDS